MNRCNQLRIISFTLIPHITYIYQLLNIVYFQLLKHYYNQAINRVVREYENIIFNKVEFLIIFQSV